MVDARHERLRKEMANHNVNIQATIKYDKECTYKGSRYLTKSEINEYIKAVDKDEYLKSIGKFETEEC